MVHLFKDPWILFSTRSTLGILDLLDVLLDLALLQLVFWNRCAGLPTIVLLPRYSTFWS